MLRKLRRRVLAILAIYAWLPFAFARPMPRTTMPQQSASLGGAAIADIDLSGFNLLDSTRSIQVGADCSTGHGLGANDVCINGVAEHNGLLWADAGITVSGAALTMTGQNIVLAGNNITDATQPIELGSSCATSQALGANATLICGAAEVDGVLYADAGVVLPMGQNLSVGVTDGSIFALRDLATDQSVLTTSTNRYLLLVERADSAGYSIGTATNPTLRIHSADITDTTQWIQTSHNQTDAVLETGLGDLILTPAGADVTLTASDLNIALGKSLELGGSTGAILVLQDFASDGAVLALGPSNTLLITENADVAGYAIAAKTNPTIRVHSATIGTTTQWEQFYHDQVDGNIETGLGDINLIPAGGDVNLGTANLLSTGFISAPSSFVELGAACSTDHSLGTGDTCSGELEVNGTLWVDGNTVHGAFNTIQWSTGATVPQIFQKDTTSDTFFFASNASRYFIFVEGADSAGYTIGSAATNPVIRVHSADVTTTTQWLQVYHDQTDGNIETGLGDLKVIPAGGDVNISAADVNLDLGKVVELAGSTGMSIGVADLTTDGGYIALGPSKTLVIIENGDTPYNINGGTNPQFRVHSADVSDTTLHILMLHNQTDGLIQTGAGSLYLNPATDILKMDSRTCAQVGAAGTAGRMALISDALVTDKWAWCLDNGTNWVVPDGTDTACC